MLQERITRALACCLDAFSAREPVSTSLENALAKAGIALVMSGLSFRRTGTVICHSAPEVAGGAS
jgi:hypothetical protein